MAEAIVNDKLGTAWIAYSAGTKPAGYVHPLALRSLKEIGIHHEGKSKNVNDFINTDFDLVVTVCDSAALECPLWLGPEETIHMGFPDPTQAAGSETQIIDEFRRVRNAIQNQIPELLAEYA
jgi:arsenate reductase